MKGGETQTELAPLNIHGDILESILTRVSLIDLVPASYVSKSWKLAVSTSLRFNRIKPWRLIFIQNTASPYSTTTLAYDPRSQIWVQIQQYRSSSIKYVSPLRSSHSTLLYMLSPLKFCFSFDPLHLTWHEIDAPLVLRTDPIVAVVRQFVIVAGGTCDFEDDPLAVEMYNLDTCTWETCESMPAIFKYSAYSMWHSVAVNPTMNKMFVAEKRKGVAFSFDTITKSWKGPYNLLPDHREDICYFFIGFVNSDRLLLLALVGDDMERVERVKLWEVMGESLDFYREIGEMPREFVEKLKAGNDGMFSMTVSSISVNVMDDFVYVSNNSSTSGGGEVMVMCEIGGGEGGACKWTSVQDIVTGDADWCRLTNRLVLACSNVGLVDLDRARTCAKFTVKDRGRLHVMWSKEEKDKKQVQFVIS